MLCLVLSIAHNPNQNSHKHTPTRLSNHSIDSTITHGAMPPICSLSHLIFLSMLYILIIKFHIFVAKQPIALQHWCFLIIKPRYAASIEWLVVAILDSQRLAMDLLLWFLYHSQPESIRLQFPITHKETTIFNRRKVCDTPNPY